jgi:hypothetical protein
MLGYIADTTQEAANTFFPGYAKAMTDVGKERAIDAIGARVLPALHQAETDT